MMMFQVKLALDYPLVTLRFGPHVADLHLRIRE